MRGLSKVIPPLATSSQSRKPHRPPARSPLRDPHVRAKARRERAPARAQAKPSTHGPCSATQLRGAGINKGIHSFGLSAAVGELVCLAATVLWLPALLAYLEQRRSKNGLARAGERS
jgi:hypothetical protein